MAAQQIADLYGSVGFRLDGKSWATLDKFEKRLDGIQHKLSKGLTGRFSGTGGGSGGGGQGGPGRGGGGSRGGARGGLSMAGSTLSNIHTLGMTITGGALTLAGKSIVDATSKYDGLRSSLLAATGSAAAADAEFKFLEDTSKRLGQVTTEIAKPFVNFSVSAREMGVSAEDTRLIYTQMAEASRGLNLSADDTAGIFRALSQMFSKATVQSEELKGQLGERLPGAFAVAARVMGMTTKELGLQLKAGNVLATDLIPKLSKEYQRLVKDTGAFARATKSTSFVVGRLSEEWNRMLDRLGRGEAGDGLRELMLSFTEFFEGFGAEGSNASKFFGMIARFVRAILADFELLTDATGKLLDFMGPTGTKLVTAFFLALSIGLAKSSKAAKGFKLLAGLGIAIALIEDLKAFFEGESSATGKLLQYMFGIGGRDALFKEVQKLFDDIGKAWEEKDFTSFIGKIFNPNYDPDRTGFKATANAAATFIGTKFSGIDQFPSYTNDTSSNRDIGGRPIVVEQMTVIASDPTELSDGVISGLAFETPTGSN